MGLVQSGLGRSPGLSRRSFIGLAAAGSAALGVAAAELPAAAAVVPATYAALLANPVVHVAHRGSAYDWPEMTRHAYRKATEVPGVQALEISVRLSADGVLVCSHDATTGRLCGVDYTIASQTWATLSQLWVSGKETIDPNQPSRKFTRLEDVLALASDRFVLYVEPKTSAANIPLMERMAALGQPERVVWKQPVNSKLFATAKELGFGTWGYVLDEPAHLDRLAELAASDAIDMLGTPGGEPDEFVSRIVAAADTNSKRTMMWGVRTLAQRSRALSLGCTGIMSAAIAEMLAAPAL